MFASVSNKPIRLAALRRRLPPIVHWSQHYGVLQQIALALAIAGTICILAMVAMPSAIYAGASTIATLVHEAFHVLADAAFHGHWGDIVLYPDGGGHAHVRYSGPVSTIIIAMAGIVGTAWMSALLLGVGITRTCISGVLGFGGAAMFLMTMFLVSAPGGSIVLAYGVAIVCIVVALSPVGGLIKSVCALVAGIALTWQVYRGLPYLSTDFIDGAPSRPSDSMIMARAMGQTDLGDTPEILMLLIVIGYLTSALLSWAWINRHI